MGLPPVSRWREGAKCRVRERERWEKEIKRKQARMRRTEGVVRDGKGERLRDWEEEEGR